VARARPRDTLLLAAAATITGHVYASCRTAAADFTPVAHIGNVDYVLMVNGDCRQIRQN
jgi:tripartite-type tricarboxylate transporter receptor subunit TctC